MTLSASPLQRACLYWLPSFLYAAAIFYLSHQSEIPEPARVLPAYVWHFLEYGFFAATLSWSATTGYSRTFSAGRKLSVGFLSIIYAISDEFHQSYIPGREASFGDVAADALGTFVFLALAYFLKNDAGEF
ncbi:MAG: VanZ family protein [Acidobacteria bacterium]|nr:VanZ family protein [Acidobacteriota bacterium]